MTEEKNFKIEFAPGCFDHFDGTQEELDSLVKKIMGMFEGKSREEIEAMSTPLDEEGFEDLPDEIKDQLINGMDQGLTDGFKRKLQ